MSLHHCSIIKKTVKKEWKQTQKEKKYKKEEIIRLSKFESNTRNNHFNCTLLKLPLKVPTIIISNPKLLVLF